ncbi:uncharacterized protein LOC126779130 [Nymphalis io]|uniref:uncharacterized protein LOC126779130 n=1 Tax=Inachis io TaxID=171585 RepID=UPI00216A6973|nr:uncharacterized protein LOC126779130 [Nymphalis io]
MMFYIYLITIVIPIFIQQATQVPILKSNNVKSLKTITPKHSYPVISESDTRPELYLHIYPLKKLKFQKELNMENNKKLSQGKVPANGKLADKYIKNKLLYQTEDDVYIDFDNNEKDNEMKYDEQDKRPEYDAYGKRYYRVATDDVSGDGIKQYVYEDDFGTRYHKLYVIDDRSGYVVINGVRYQRTPQRRPEKLSPRNKNVQLNKEIYSKPIQNFKQRNVNVSFSKLSGHMGKVTQTRNRSHFKN